MRRTPYTDRANRNKQPLISNLKDVFDPLSLKGPKRQSLKISPHVLAYMPEKQKQYHFSQRNSRQQIKRPLTVSRANSQLKNISQDKESSQSKPKDLWISTLKQMRTNQISRDSDHSKGRIYRGNSWKPQQRFKTPRQSHERVKSRYSSGLIPSSREQRSSMRAKNMTNGIMDLLNKSIPHRKNSHSEVKTDKKEDDYFQYVMRFSYRTKKGSIPSNPNKVNQDSYIITPNIANKTYQHFFAICDGHGPLGHHVSGFIKNSLPNAVINSKNLLTNPSEALMKAFEQAYQKLIKQSKIDMSFSGSTVVATYLHQNKLYCCNVGDSRAIIGRKSHNDKKWKAIALSQDHKPTILKEVERIKKMGGRVEAYKDDYGEEIGPLRVWVKNENVPGLAMTRSFGDLVGASVGVSPVPQIKQFDLTEQDHILIIASDGVFQFLENDQVIDIVTPFYEKKQIQQASDKLLSMAHQSWSKHSSIIDDITFILIFIHYNEV